MYGVHTTRLHITALVMCLACWLTPICTFSAQLGGSHGSSTNQSVVFIEDGELYVGRAEGGGYICSRVAGVSGASAASTSEPGIVAVIQGDRVLVINATSGKIQAFPRLVGSYSLAVLNGGRSVLVGRVHTDYAGDFGLWLLRAPGGTPQLVYPPASADFGVNNIISVSPNGKHAAFGGASIGLRIASTGSWRPVQMPQSASEMTLTGFAWLDDHSLALAVSQPELGATMPAGLYRLDIRSRSVNLWPKFLVQRKSNVSIDSLDYSPTDHLYAIGRSAYGENDLAQNISTYVEMVDSRTGKSYRLGTTSHLTTCGFSRDGRMLLVLLQVRGYDEDCYCYDLKAKTFTLVARNVTEAHWM